MERRTFLAATCATTLIPSSLMAATEAPASQTVSVACEYSNVVRHESGLWANMDVSLDGQPLGRIGVLLDKEKKTLRVWDFRGLQEAHHDRVADEVTAIGNALHKASLQEAQKRMEAVAEQFSNGAYERLPPSSQKHVSSLLRQLQEAVTRLEQQRT